MKSNRYTIIPVLVVDSKYWLILFRVALLAEYRGHMRHPFVRPITPIPRTEHRYN